MTPRLAPWRAFLLGAAIIALCCLAWSEHRELVELRSANKAANAVERRDRMEIQRLRGQILAYMKASDWRPPVGSRAGAVEPGGEAGNSGNVDLTPFMKRDPAYAALRHRVLLRAVRVTYGDLAALNLPPDRLQKLTELLLDRCAAPQDARDAALQQGLKDGSPEYLQAVANSVNDAENDIKSFLGQSAYDQLLANENRINLASTLETTVGNYLAAAGIPLSGDQIAALADAQQKLREASPEIQNQALEARAAEVLTPEQLQLFVENIDLQDDVRELQQRALEAAKKQYGEVNSWSTTGP
jgi:hypothetical protein